MVGSIVVAGVLTHLLLHSTCNLKAAQKKIWELMFYKFELGHNTSEVAKSICCMKSEDATDLSVVNFKECKMKG